MDGVILNRTGHTATVTIDRPEDENRLTPAVLERLERIVAEFEKDTHTLAVVFSGAGDQFFSIGMLHPRVRVKLSKDEILGIVRLANRLFDRIEAMPQVTIAALNGATRAAGAELSLACDIRLAASHATFGVPEAKWGGFPGAGAPVRLPGIVGKARALELLCAARELDASEMLAFGIVLEVYPKEELRLRTSDLAERIGTCGPLAVRGAKRIVNQRLTEGFRAARELSDALRYALEDTHDMKEGTAALLEGRPPRFTGR